MFFVTFLQSSRNSSLETFAMSIESDSLNDKEVINEMKSRFSKTKSTDDIVDVDDEKSRAKVNKRYFG